MEDVILDPWQKEALEYDGHLVLCTGRQSGKTFIMARKAGKYMIEHKGSRIIVVSLTEDQAELIIVMILDYLQKHHKEMLAKGSKKPTKRRIWLKNKSMVLARPVGNTGDAVRGFTGDVLIIDEASRMPEMTFTAAKPTLMTTGGQIWMCSTPFGKQGYFYESYLNKNNRFKVIHTNSEEVAKSRPITETWTKERHEGALRHLEEEKKDMSELQYAQEYLGEFIDDLRQFYSDEIIDKACTLKPAQIIDRRHPHFLGCDIARMGGDYGTWEIIKKIDNEHFEHVYHEQKNKIPTTYTFNRIVQLTKEWKFKEIGIDAGSGSLGVGVLDFLLKEPIVRKKVVALNNRSIALDKDGKRTRMLLKEDMHSIMLSLMEMGRLKLLDNEEVRLSLKSTQYEYVRKEGMPTKIRIFGRNMHIVEGLCRAVYLANQKHLNISINYI